MEKYKKQKFLAVSLSLLACFTMTLPHVERKVSASIEEDSVNPIARYEFKDAANPGKDSMGNYDLITQIADGKTEGAVNVSEGVATFDGTAGLIPGSEEKDISEKLNSFTLAFDVKTSGTNGGWASPAGFGWNGWDATKWGTFQFSSGSDILRFTTASNLVEGTSNVDGNPNPYWGKEIGNIGTSDFHKVILTVNTSSTIDVYLDGVNKYSYKTPENFSLKDSNMSFGLGGDSAWNHIYNAFIGSLKNVEIYDFAFNELQTIAYNINGCLTAKDIAEQEVVNPLSKYEFEDETNPGKE